MKQVKLGLTIILVMSLLLGLSSLHIMAQDDVIEDMTFRETDIRDVLQAIAEVADVNLVTDSSVSGEVTIHLQDITFSEALKMVTQTEGLAYQWDENTIVVATPDRIEEIYEEERTRIIDLQDTDLESVQGVLSGVFPDLNVVASERTGQVVVTGERDMVKKALELVDNLDLAFEDEEAVETEQVQVRDLDNLIESVKNVYSDVVVERSGVNNLVIFSGPEQDVENALELVSSLEEEEDYALEEDGDMVQEVARVENAELEQVAEEIKTLHSSLEVEKNDETNQLVISGPESDVEAAIEVAREADSARSPGTEVLQIDYMEMDYFEETIGDLYPDVNLNIDTERRTAVIRGSRNELEEIVALVEEIDLPRRQILIEVQIEEVERSRLNELGIDTDSLSRIEFLEADDGLLPEMEVTWPEFLSTLENESIGETLANPRLMTLNGEDARLLLGDQVPVYVDDDEGNRQVEYIEAGVSLEFEPWLTEDDSIRMDVQPTVSSISAPPEGGELPGINTRETETTIRLNDGESFVIGGLIQNDMSETESGIPYLKEIPILGNLFKSTSEDESETELIIMVKPEIVEREEIEDEDVDSEGSQAKITGEDGNEVKPIEDEDEEDTEKEEPAVRADEEDVDTAAPEDEEDSESGDEAEESTEKSTEADVSLEEASREEEEEPSSTELARTLNSVRRTREKEELPSVLNYLHPVGEDDTLDDIAARYGVSVSSIENENNLDGELKPDTLLTVPVPSSQLYRMEEGDTISSISREFDINVDEIIELNDLENVEDISTGTIIILPEEIK
ncbi:MAG: secretin N-terminal domain-containing protein [Halanaerobiaceae bacterium]